MTIVKANKPKPFAAHALGGRKEDINEARVFIPLSKCWYLGLRGDVGGFGLGNASDLALNGNAFFTWQASPVFSVQLGYRALYMKYNRGFARVEAK
jgi:hypothetical protein